MRDKDLDGTRLKFQSKLLRIFSTITDKERYVINNQINANEKKRKYK